MLIKMFTGVEDYEKTLRMRRLIFIALLLVGLVGFVCYFLLVQNSDLPDFARGFYLGGASGITGAAVAFLMRNEYLIAHPDARKKARIKETDEREKNISRTALFFAGMVTFFLTAAALFVLLPLNMGAFYALLGVIAVYFLSFIGATVWLNKHR